MAQVCGICGKGKMFGKKVSHSHRHSAKSWAPNLRRVRIVEDGTPKRIKVCASCLKKANQDA